MASEVLPKKRDALDFVLALMFLAVFLAMLVLNCIYCRLIHFGYLALFLVQPWLFCFFWRYYRKHVLSRKVRIIIRTISIVVSVALLLFSMWAMLMNEIFGPVKDPIYYQHLLKIYGYPEEESMLHFPQSVPKGAKNVRFFETPEVLQGGSDFVLKYRTSNTEIKDVLNKYEPKATKIMRDGDYENGKIDYDEVPHLPKDAIGYEDIPSDFELIILGSHPYKPYDWNHGYTYGVAVSRQRNEVIYWSEHW